MATAKKRLKGSKAGKVSAGGKKSVKATTSGSRAAGKARPASGKSASKVTRASKAGRAAKAAVVTKAASKAKAARAAKPAGGAKAARASKVKSNGAAKARKTATAVTSRISGRGAGSVTRTVRAGKVTAPKPTAKSTSKISKETPVRKTRKSDLNAVKKQLLERREQLLANLRRLTTGGTDSLEKPVGDRADDASFDLELDTSYSTAEREAEELRLIDVALDKIANDTYGVCEECSQPIESPRLKALPYAVLCLACKQNEELQRSARPSEIMYGRLEDE